MPKRKRSQNSDSRRSKNAESDDIYEETEYEDNHEIVFPLDPNDSGASNNDDLNTDKPQFYNVSYYTVFDNYLESQKLLESDHKYEWIEGEKIISGNLDDILLLPNNIKTKIRGSTPVQLFELFFSKEIKEYIISATRENGFNLNLTDLETFVGITLTLYNIRSDQRDY